MNQLILFILLMFRYILCNAQSWTQLTDFPGTQRDDGAVFTISNKAYCFSGLEVGWQCTGNGYVFDGISETWSPMAPLPMGNERQYATAFSYNENGYVVGGLNCSGICLKDFWKYSVSTNSWTALPDFPGQGRQGMSNFMIKGKLYIIGGRITDNSTLNEVWQFDFATSSWTQKNSLPLPGMCRGVAFTIDTLGYVCYGINNTAAGTFNHSMCQYNYISDDWSFFPNVVLSARNYVACAVTNKQACLYGGQDSMNVITNDINLFNPSDTSLTTYTGIPTIGRKGTMAFSLNDIFYVTTGLDVNQNRIKETWKNASFVDIKENSTLSTKLKIYPNPCNEKVFVNLSNQKNAIIKLTNQLGQTVYQETIESRILEINTSQYQNGIYYLTVQKDDIFLSEKIMIIN